MEPMLLLPAPTCPRAGTGHTSRSWTATALAITTDDRVTLQPRNKLVDYRTRCEW